MKLTVLGSGYFIPTANRNNSGYLLEIDGEKILLDTGSGILRQLIRCGYTIWDISRIFYSHLHIDHFADLLPILFTRKYTQPISETGELIIFGHEDLANILSEFEKLFGKWIINEKYPFEFHKIVLESYSFESYNVTVFKGIHAEQSLMYRFEDKQGKTLLYTGDTDLSDTLIEAAMGVDVLLTEFSSTNEYPVPGHLSPQKISTLLERCRPKLTILSHLTPETEKGTIIDSINVPSDCVLQLAEDFRSWEI